VIYHNGEFQPAGEARVSASDGGLLHGAGVFETMRAAGGRVFRLDRHLARLRRSVAALIRPIEADALPEEAVFAELLRRNALNSARMRMTVTAGAVSAEPSGEASPLTVLITAAPLQEYPPEFYARGIAVVLCPFRQSPSDPIAGHKTTAYLPRLLGLRAAGQAQSIEALWFTTENRLAEGCISNVFVAKNGVLRTPPLDTPVLPGIARACVLEIAAAAEIESREEPLTINDLLDADEVLLTNTIMRVMPVIRVERRDIGEGKVGPIARKLLDDYRDLIGKECPPP
jgi:branched-chain amino acid aminotransferase